MTKAELVAILARVSGGSKAAAEKAMRSFIEEIVDALAEGRSVTISGFGTFVVSRRAARNGTHPRTGKSITIPPARVPRFRPSRGLRGAIR
ncbi:MAG: HU family DNA-binding protein [Candidatus Rokuibacteriota bacterium]